MIAQQPYMTKELMHNKLNWNGDQTPTIVESKDFGSSCLIQLLPSLKSTDQNKIRKMIVKVHSGKQALLGVATKETNINNEGQKNTYDKNDRCFWFPDFNCFTLDKNRDQTTSEFDPRGKTIVVEANTGTGDITYSELNG